MSAGRATTGAYGIATWQLFYDRTSVSVLAVDGTGSPVFSERWLLGKVSPRGKQLEYLQVFEANGVQHAAAIGADGSVLTSQLDQHDHDVNQALFNDLSSAYPGALSSLKGQSERIVPYDNSCPVDIVGIALSGISLLGCIAPWTIIGGIACVAGSAGFLLSANQLASCGDQCTAAFPDRHLSCVPTNVTAPDGTMMVENLCACACM